MSSPATYAPPDPLLSRLADRLDAAPRDTRLTWRRTARPDQILPGGDWRITYFQGGRGAGKTRSSAQGLAELILATPEPCDWGIVAPTYRAAWTTCVEGESGFLAALGTSAAEVKRGDSRLVAYAHRTNAEIGLRSGHVVYVDSANDGALRVQGKNLTACWCSEIGLWLKWATAWDESIAYAVRRGASKIIADGTPKVSRPAAKLIRRLLRDEPGVIVRRLRTVDNLANLSETFYRAVVARATGTRLERQELEGELLDDVENALWTRDLLEAIQVDDIPGGDYAGLAQVYVGADPSDGTEESDECAYTVCGMGQDRRLYIPESWGGRIGPVAFLKRVVLTADQWRGTVVLEKNHGGAYLEATLRQVMRDLGVTVPYMVVHASQAKRTRAEPVAALYERGIIRHARGPHVELEDQLVTFTGAAGERSPDRLDSCLVADTPVLTARGDVPIEQVVPGDLAWTRQGWKPVTAAALTRRNAQVMTVGLSDGRSLTGTPDHRIWVEQKGWSRLDSLVWGDILSAWQSPPFPSLTAASSTRGIRTATSGLTGSTTTRPETVGAARSTVTSGRTPIPARRFRRAGTFTMTTTTRSTMTRRTSSPSLLATMAKSTRTSSLISAGTGSTPSGRSRRRGTDRRQGWLGMRRSAAALGRTANPSTPRPAPNAGTSSSRTWIRLPAPRLTTATARGAASIAPVKASIPKRSPAPSAETTSPGTGAASGPRPVPVSVVRLCAVSERRDVYDLTVADAHEFTAAGVIVHNCVWAVSPFLDHDFDLSASRRPLGPRHWAVHDELERMTQDPAARMRARLGQDYGREDSWSADSFAPQADDGRPDRPNVRSWR